MWSFDMYHFSEHYHAIVDNGSVDLARSVGELVAFTQSALNEPDRNKEAMLKTLTQKAAFCDGTSGKRFFEIVETIVDARALHQVPADFLDRHGTATQPSLPNVVDCRVMDAPQ